MNIACVICSDLFTPSADVHVTKCGHMFHFLCLTQWLERSHSCPQCRNKCSSKNIQKVYFNIGNLDTSTIDVGSLQEKLDNAELQIRAKQAALNKAVSEIGTLKDIQKKTIKTVTALEKRLEQNDFLQNGLREQISILKAEKASLETRKNEANQLKQQIELMSSVQTILSTTKVDADQLLKDNTNRETLATWVAALKRELRISENKNKETRNALRSTQLELKVQQDLRKSLQEKVLHLESENYNMNEKIKSGQNNKIALNIPLNSPEEECDTPKPRKRTAPCVETIVIDDSPTTSRMVQTIEESDSPYLQIKSSSVGLTPLLKLHKGLTKRPVSSDASGLTRAASDLSEKYLILKRPRIGIVDKTTSYKPPNMVSNGLGGSEKIPNFPDFPVPKKMDSNNSKTYLLSRLKSGKLKRLDSATNTKTTFLRD